MQPVRITPNPATKPSPFPRAAPVIQLKIPQYRVLAALRSVGLGAIGRPRIGELIGTSPISGTITRAFRGLRAGSSSGAAHPGLLALGFVEELEIDVDGKVELLYRITDTGLTALEAAERDGTAGKVGSLRAADMSTNKRYKID